LSIGLVLVGAFFAAPAGARALVDEPSTGDFAAQRLVRLEVFGSATEAEQLRASLSESFGRISVALEFVVSDGEPARVESPDDARIVVQVDLRRPGVAEVRLARAGEPFGEARAVPQRESRELLLEETALVIYTATESLLNEGREVPPPPLPAPSTTEVAVPAPPPVPRAPTVERDSLQKPVPQATPWLVEGAMLVSARAYADDASVVPGFGLGVRTRVGAGRFVPAFWVRGEYHFPFTQTTQGVQLSTTVWSFRVEPALDLVRHGAFALELGAGGGADIFVVSPVSSAAGVELSPERRDVSGIVSALLAASLETGNATRVVLTATLDYDLAPRSYSVAQGDERWVLLEPWRVRPALALGFLFDAAGRRQP
jgi:hypothetical protein